MLREFVEIDNGDSRARGVAMKDTRVFLRRTPDEFPGLPGESLIDALQLEPMATATIHDAGGELAWASRTQRGRWALTRRGAARVDAEGIGALTIFFDGTSELRPATWRRSA